MNARRIIVPLDGSVLAEAALPKAIEVARATPGARLTLLRAAEASALPVRDPIEAQIVVIRDAEDYLEAVAASLEGEGVPVTTSVWYGPPAAAIVDAAAATRAELIVMSTHGRSGLNRLVLGSVAESVLRATHVPILLLRPDRAPVARPIGAAKQTPAKETTHAV
jgi:nucleotide-binding universal stress UspA family protein